MKFILSKNTVVENTFTSKPILNAVEILERDIKKSFTESKLPQNKIILCENKLLASECYEVKVSENITVYAQDDLGFVYGILYISEKFLGIKPFWFWLDQKIEPVEAIEIEHGAHSSKKPIIRYRGWFFNDEVLIMRWSINGDGVLPWKMAFEALLRCGGNMAIPGTDKNAIKNRSLAAGMGLIITHHHAEPLGAEMFVRKYPGISPNYSEQSERFEALWREAIEEQKDYNVIWNVGFRGQGDCPFWSNDSSGKYNTPEKRGRLIGELIKKQCDMIREKVENPVFCTNLYGEITELYREGHIELPDDVIKISADNGYGKMVTRRRDNHCVRVESLSEQDSGSKGIYYHVSFYDLQAANHITSFPNSVDFIEKQLNTVLEKGGNDYWLINCSNVRPHAYMLDAIRKKWYGETISDETHSKEFCSNYHQADFSQAYREYPDAMLSYGTEDDERCGEQFYTENVRMIATQFIRNRSANTGKLKWLTGDVPLMDQARHISRICHGGKDKIEALFGRCEELSKKHESKLFDTTLFLSVKIHRYCSEGVMLFTEGLEMFEKGEYKQSFMTLGKAAEYFDLAQSEMRGSEYGVWEGFYMNDCFADIKHTAYMVKKVMGVVREFGDNARHDLWYREAVYPIEDRFVYTLLVNDNHMTDWEMYQAFKNCPW